MKCHYHTHKGKKYFIPGCYAMMYETKPDPKVCTCGSEKKDPEEVIRRLKERVARLNQMVRDLRKKVNPSGE